MSENKHPIIELINLFDLNNIIKNSKDQLNGKIMCDDKDLETFDTMYERMLIDLVSGATQDLLPYGFVDDFLLKLRFLKIKYEEK